MPANNIGARLTREFEFARHMPLQKIWRRATAPLRRLAPPPAAGALAPRDPSQPFFQIVDGRADVQETSTGWRLGFLNVERDFSSPIDWRSPPGPAHQLWRMNLHYMEFLEAIEDTADFIFWIDQWIAGNPLNATTREDAWNPYALSIRVVMWMQELSIHRPELDDAFLARAHDSLAAQLAFLAANLETDLEGNHLVKNLKALIFAGRYFKGAQADAWRARALSLLARQLKKQILPDGVHAERSVSYHCQVFADLLDIRWALGGDPLGGALDRALAGMAQAAADLTHPDGDPALFNDAGLTMAHRASQCLAAYERIFDVKPWRRLSFAYPDAGYFGSNGGLYVVADCGAIAPDDLPAHGHGDLLSFELSAHGRRFIVDQGVFEYIAGERRAQSRSAASHNTLCFAGADQADFYGAFRVGRRPRAFVRQWRTNELGDFTLEGTHSGFDHLPGRPRHVRAFEGSARALTIEDRVEGDAPCPATIGLLLHPHVRAIATPQGLTLQHPEGRVYFQCDRAFRVEPAVWWPDMGVEIPTQRIIIDLLIGETSCVTRLALDEMDHT
jgi:uncharacterized heparinase superfamily protein